MQYQCRVAGKFYQQLQEHLFPGDGLEAVAFLLCGRHTSEELSILLSHQLVLIPHKECDRSADHVTWKTERVIPLLEEAERRNLGIIKIHSHPAGYEHFSKRDDESDDQFFKTVFNWSETDSIHGSAILLPDGRILGRYFTPAMKPLPFDKITVVGEQFKAWSINENNLDDFAQRTIQAFGEKTYTLLKGLKAAVVGCSGTGSITSEQLYRLGIGQLVLADPDKVEVKNLNRILNTQRKDCLPARYKVDVLTEAIHAADLGTKVTPYPANLYESRKVLLDLISCDILFGCVDTAEGRHLLNQISNFYLIPYVDMGVKLQADGQGGISGIAGSVNYIQPGLSSLLTRKVYNTDRLFEEGLQREDPKEFEKRRQMGYVRDANVDRPAVISINMLISSMAINEFLNRIHPYRDEPPGQYARIIVDYAANCIINEPESDFEVDTLAAKYTGRGDVKPFLRMPELG